ncbi:dihydroorotase [Capsaspora owczarzaki ATCC 30864]|uniref:dihydroorotase n=2 Tax=Capsaspora owczarzaki (strain ATCC 30864) TaxID=595528 RepID=A0A0D2WR68_CAPO3|nr:dihydroorotase [Capsaspora owczarzaki ATCC 30864]
MSLTPAPTAATTLTLPAAADLHVHLRQGDLMRMVVPHIRRGGVVRVLVMPNLKPAIASTEQALAYKRELEQIDASVDYWMTLYLGPEITPDEIRKAAAAGIKGVKSYPRGVTTNSESGIESYTAYYPVFKAMEETNMVLNLHGEVPSNPKDDICVMNAEVHFLKHLEQLHRDFPKLRIVLEHVTTGAAVRKVLELGDTVAATVTVHHLSLIVDDWAGKNHNYCKPVAKYPSDRRALWDAILSGSPKFFLGSDSAPHPRSTKECASGCAGVYTQPHVLPYLASVFEQYNALDKLQAFTSDNGNRFYQAKPSTDTVTLVREPLTVESELSYGDASAAQPAVVPFQAGETLPWRLA